MPTKSMGVAKIIVAFHFDLCSDSIFAHMEYTRMTQALKQIDMTHMVKPSTFDNPMRHNVFIVEGRDKERGILDCFVELPFYRATSRQLFDHYFKHNPDKSVASQEEVAKWYNDQGIFFRPKTWC